MDGPGKPVDPNSNVPEPEPHDGNREQLTLFSNFTPLVLSTMTKYSTSDESYTVSISTCTCIACGLKKNNNNNQHLLCWLVYV